MKYCIRPVLLLMFYLLFCLVIQAWDHAWTADLSRRGDEAAHYVNSVLLHDYLTNGIGANPMHYAVQLYKHYPRVTIGQWPPFFYLIQGIVFIGTGISIFAAMMFQALIASVTALLVALIVVRLRAEIDRWLIGGLAGFVFLLAPEVLRQIGTVMTDTCLSLAGLLAVISWARYDQTRSARWSAAFGIAALAAILTNGAGFGLAALPILYSALTGRFRILVLWQTWIPAVIVVIIAAPWYLLTAGLVSGSWVYSLGLNYEKEAVSGFSIGLAETVGLPLLTAFLFGAARSAWKARHGSGEEVVLSCTAGAVGLLAIHLVVPADIQPRYLIPLTPEIVIVSIVGLSSQLAKMGSALRVSIFLVYFLANEATIHEPLLKSRHVMNDTVAEVLSSPASGPLVLVASGAVGEGAIAAAFAAQDKHRAFYVLRGSKVLSQSNFLGGDYRLRFASATQVADWIEQNRISWVIVDDSKDGMQWPQNEQLLLAIEMMKQQLSLVSDRQDSEGHVRLYRTRSASPNQEQISAVLSQTDIKKMF